MTAKRISLAAGGLVLAAVLALGLAQLADQHRTAASGAPALTAAQIQARLHGSPATLAVLHAQAGALLQGDASALHARLAALRGTPVVVNKWASWCGPCRAELGAFQHASTDYGRQVAFLGIDSGDSGRGGALAFLRSTPVGYPSYYDPSGALGDAVTGSTATPVTVFYDRHGGHYTHQGPYASIVALERDVRRYAIGA